MKPFEIESKLLSIQQTHLLAFWNTLTEEQQLLLAGQIKQLDTAIFDTQRALLQENPIPSRSSINPVQDYARSRNQENKERGLQLLEQHKCGCILVAGGQGTRLNQGLSKGMVPITPIMHKSLFQVFAEKTAAAGKRSGVLLPLAIMTSPLNHGPIVSYFQSNHYFGLQPDQVFFYSQGTLPFLDRQGRLFLEDKFSLAMGPDGNGSALRSFIDAGIWKQWHDQGVEQVHFVLVDNALADPFDAEMLGFHVAQKNDITIKSTYRLNEEEKVGVLVEEKGKIKVVEYSEMDESERKARQPKGELKYPLANLSLFCFSMEFIGNQAYDNYALLPMHKAYKAARYLDAEGKFVQSKDPIAWKFERYIFDLLRFAGRVQVLVYPREDCFAPLKNPQGSDSIETVQAALVNRDKKIIKEITLQDPPAEPLELSQDFHYPTADLLNRWKGRALPHEAYIYD